MSVVDNFESYSNGDLTGQGGWSGSTEYDVQTSIVQAGSKAVHSGGTNSKIEQTFTLEATGAQILRGRVTSTLSDKWALRIKEGSSNRIAIKTNGLYIFRD